LGVDFKSKDIDVAGDKIKINVWDTAGEEEYRTVTNSYYRNANAILVVFDVTDTDSFNRVVNWKGEGDRFADNAIHAIVGNKIDIEDERKIKKTEAEELANKLNATYFEVSAKTGQGIDALFEGVASLVLKKAVPQRKDSRKVKVNAAPKKNFCILL